MKAVLQLLHREGWGVGVQGGSGNREETAFKNVAGEGRRQRERRRSRRGGGKL